MSKDDETYGQGSTHKRIFVGQTIFDVERNLEGLVTFLSETPKEITVIWDISWNSTSELSAKNKNKELLTVFKCETMLDDLLDERKYRFSNEQSEKEQKKN